MAKQGERNTALRHCGIDHHAVLGVFFYFFLKNQIKAACG